MEGTEETRDDLHPRDQADDDGSDCDNVDHPSDRERIGGNATCPVSRPENEHSCPPVGDRGYRERANPIQPQSTAGGSTVDKNPRATYSGRPRLEHRAEVHQSKHRTYRTPLGNQASERDDAPEPHGGPRPLNRRVNTSKMPVDGTATNETGEPYHARE
jgi:hypothetical protein